MMISVLLSIHPILTHTTHDSQVKPRQLTQYTLTSQLLLLKGLRKSTVKVGINSKQNRISLYYSLQAVAAGCLTLEKNTPDIQQGFETALLNDKE